MTQALIQVVARAKCATCQRRFGASNVQVIGRRENVWAMRVHCRECDTHALVLAVIADAARSLYTDLDPDEWTRLNQRPPISEDDVIEFYEFMHAYTGDFTDILIDPLLNE